MAPAKTPLGRFLTDRLTELDISMREFARRIGVSNVFVIYVKSGKARFPPDQFAKWCKVLELSEAKQEEFLRIALVAQAPKELQEFIRQLEAKVDGMERGSRSQRAKDPR